MEDLEFDLNMESKVNETINSFPTNPYDLTSDMEKWQELLSAEAARTNRAKTQATANRKAIHQAAETRQSRWASEQQNQQDYMSYRVP